MHLSSDHIPKQLCLGHLHASGLCTSYKVCPWEDWPREGTCVTLESTQAVWVPGIQLECESGTPDGPAPWTSRIPHAMGRGLSRREREQDPLSVGPIAEAPLLESKGHARNGLSAVLTVTHLPYTPLPMSPAARPPEQTLCVSFGPLVINCYPGLTSLSEPSTEKSKTILNSH